jgi:hypothetical protein
MIFFMISLSIWLLPFTNGMPQGLSEISAEKLSPNCTVIEERDKVAMPCIFPFKFRGKVFFDCTNETDPDGKSWCSTKLDDSGTHVGKGGYWGYCGDRCNVEITTAKTLVDISPSPEAADTSNEAFKAALADIAEGNKTIL